MTKELFVSSTPHESKVGLVEDDQLAEVYLERENEYTLAGSIYKGRVTRVLPGMQSAFVDIGLERDAFLYVSDFMELENQDDDLDDVPATAIVPESRATDSSSAETSEQESEGENGAAAFSELPGETRANANTDQREDRGGYRGRRRRRSPRRGPNGAEPKYSRPTEVAPRPEREQPREQSRDEYGPPAGYQPIILPGESISKYRGKPQPVTAPERAVAQAEPDPAISHAFAEDEPIFAQPGHETEVTQDLPLAFEEPPAHSPEMEREAFATAPPFDSEHSDDWDREQKRLHQIHVAEVFGGVEAADSDAEDTFTAVSEHSDSASAQAVAAGTLEHEEIDEEEADLASYVEELEEDAAFEEMEEETTAASDFSSSQQIAASAENGSSVVAFSPDPVSGEAAEIAESEEVDEVAEEEAELEEAQAEAEALLASEGIEGGTVDARAEVRAPATTAAYTQRAPRPAFDRDRDRRGGRRFPRGRRFRRQPAQNLPQITDLLKEGQEILVQIAKEPIGKKGARITSHIALPGRFLVYMPTVNHTGVSRKIASEEERLRLKRIIISERENGHGGFIVRTAAQGADEQELRAD
ncbi:MAG TPA: ribonuclease E/G, partial [Candidatus Angelobacter sp.]|nr:ribonuclease E/G [Candidatus Angelobacter sp.]